MRIDTLKWYISSLIEETSLFVNKRIEFVNFSKEALNLIDNLDNAYENMIYPFFQKAKNAEFNIDILAYDLDGLQESNINHYDLYYFEMWVKRVYKNLNDFKKFLDNYEDEDENELFRDSKRIRDDKTSSYKEALKLAKKLNKPVVYGYTSKRNPSKFYEIKMKEWNGDDSAFRSQYSANVIYVAYPDKD